MKQSCGESRQIRGGSVSFHWREISACGCGFPQYGKGKGRGRLKTLYVTDLDGTLLNKNAKINPYSLEVINRLVEDGLPFTYATARSLSSASVAAERLKVHTPVIAYNGAIIFQPDTGETLDFVHFTQEDAEEARRAMEELKALATGVIGSNEQDGVAKWLLENSQSGILPK